MSNDPLGGALYRPKSPSQVKEVDENNIEEKEEEKEQEEVEVEEKKEVSAP